MKQNGVAYEGEKNQRSRNLGRIIKLHYITNYMISNSIQIIWRDYTVAPILLLPGISHILLITNRLSWKNLSSWIEKGHFGRSYFFEADKWLPENACRFIIDRCSCKLQLPDYSELVLKLDVVITPSLSSNLKLSRFQEIFKIKLPQQLLAWLWIHLSNR